MRSGLRSVVAPLVAATILFAGCNDDDPMGGGDPPPDISGTYDLASLTQGGVTLTPPAVSGMFTVDETASSDTEASGTVVLDLTIPDGMGGFTMIMESGTYTIRSDGTWEQDFPSQQATGTYALVGATLTVTVTSPAQAAGVSVWQRQ